MRQKVFAAAILPLILQLADGQGTFLNLDFESANIPTLPAGQAGPPVLASDAIPGWTAYVVSPVGEATLSQVLHNGPPLDGAGVIIYDRWPTPRTY